MVGQELVVGSQGNEHWTRDGLAVLHRDRMWVKVISCEGTVTHHNWTDNYLAVREAAGVSWPGYVLHEAVCRSPVRREWSFLPRRISQEKYNRRTVERRGANLIITADQNFSTFRTVSVGRDIPGREVYPGFALLGWIVMLLTSTLLCHKDTTQGTQSILLVYENKLLHDEALESRPIRAQ